MEHFKIEIKSLCAAAWCTHEFDTQGSRGMFGLRNTFRKKATHLFSPMANTFTSSTSEALSNFLFLHDPALEYFVRQADDLGSELIYRIHYQSALI